MRSAGVRVRCMRLRLLWQAEGGLIVRYELHRLSIHRAVHEERVAQPHRNVCMHQIIVQVAARLNRTKRRRDNLGVSDGVSITARYECELGSPQLESVRAAQRVLVHVAKPFGGAVHGRGGGGGALGALVGRVGVDLVVGVVVGVVVAVSGGAGVDGVVGPPHGVFGVLGGSGVFLSVLGVGNVAQVLAQCRRVRVPVRRRNLGGRPGEVVFAQLRGETKLVQVAIADEQEDSGGRRLLQAHESAYQPGDTKFRSGIVDEGARRMVEIASPHSRTWGEHRRSVRHLGASVKRGRGGVSEPEGAVSAVSGVATVDKVGTVVCEAKFAVRVVAENARLAHPAVEVVKVALDIGYRQQRASVQRARRKRGRTQQVRGAVLHGSHDGSQRKHGHENKVADESPGPATSCVGRHLGRTPRSAVMLLSLLSERSKLCFRNYAVAVLQTAAKLQLGDGARSRADGCTSPLRRLGTS
eukprot:6190191-Pleurochrysis_carterae.AAC.1